VQSEWDRLRNGLQGIVAIEEICGMYVICLLKLTEYLSTSELAQYLLKYEACTSSGIVARIVLKVLWQWEKFLKGR